jgi:hypothetical protein
VTVQCRAFVVWGVIRIASRGGPLIEFKERFPGRRAVVQKRRKRREGVRRRRERSGAGESEGKDGWWCAKRRRELSLAEKVSSVAWPPGVQEQERSASAND